MSPTEAADWAAAFDEYTAARKTNGNAIADMALENFEEVGDILLILVGQLLSYTLLLTLYVCTDARPCGRQDISLAETS